MSNPMDDLRAAVDRARNSELTQPPLPPIVVPPRLYQFAMEKWGADDPRVKLIQPANMEFSPPIDQEINISSIKVWCQYCSRELNPDNPSCDCRARAIELDEEHRRRR